MSVHFIVAQYVPDPIADERANFGVIVFGEGQLHCHFLHRLGRLRHFGGESVEFLREFASQLERAAEGYTLSDALAHPQINDEVLRKIAGNWANSIQFTAPRISLRPADAALREMVKRYLREDDRPKKERRGRDAAAQITIRGVRLALDAKGGDRALTNELLHPNTEVQGADVPHRFDAVVANGRPYLAAHGLSFEKVNPGDIDNDVRAIAYSIGDVRRKNPQLPIGIAALRRRGRAAPKEMDRADIIFRRLKVTLLDEDEISDWAEEHLPKDLKRAAAGS